MHHDNKFDKLCLFSIGGEWFGLETFKAFLRCDLIFFNDI